MSLVTTHGLGKDYRLGSTTVTALDGIDLQIEPAEFLAIVGPSGSGKTTLLNLIGCLDLPTRGEIRLDGELIGTLSPDRLAEIRAEKLGFIFQTFNLIATLTAAENIEYPLYFQGKKPNTQVRRERVKRMLQQLKLERLADHRPDQLSGGQRQKVAIARALVTQPKMVLADEPTANLDSRSGEEIVRLMQSLHESQGVTFVFSTHDSNIVRQAKRVVELSDGRRVERRPSTMAMRA